MQGCAQSLWKQCPTAGKTVSHLDEGQDAKSLSAMGLMLGPGALLTSNHRGVILSADPATS